MFQKKKLIIVINYSTKLLIIVFVLICSLFIFDVWGFIDFAKPFIVLSGSMEPNIQTGSLVFIQPKKFGYSIGDIITFRIDNKSTVVTHRIIEYQVKDNQIFYRTKGDANKTSDSQLIGFDQIVGNVRLIIPKIGYVAKFGSTPQGFLVFVIVPSTILIYEELKKIKNQTIKILKKIMSGWLSLSILILSLNQNQTITFFTDSDNSKDNILGASRSFNNNYPHKPIECRNLIGEIENVIIGSESDDILIGSRKRDLIFGLGGNDVIKSGSGEDCIISGEGNDEIHGGSGEDIIYSNQGEDHIVAGSGNDFVDSGESDDYISGGSGSDYLNGSLGFDTLDGGSGKDDCLNSENLISCEVL